MRTQCPHCAHRFDVPHRAVLAEAERLNTRRVQNIRPALPVHRTISPGFVACGADYPNMRSTDVPEHVSCRDCLGLGNKSKAPVVVAEPNGNVLSPKDLEAKRLRDEAVKKRMGQKKF